ncbi:MAG: M1 family peptidase [Calditrichaeota bacterium]|nr:MAG: M1 family peptidase [Calditrichota bacterium]MBL1204982.1 M1 family peptidase [Calditrichota bacterium]NOG44812.1 M1 family metallopeptidase [Calditrichota bacterium]
MKTFFKWLGIIIGSLILLLIIVAGILYWYFSPDYSSGGILSENQAQYDVLHYNINLEIDAQEETIDGYTIINIKSTSDSLDVLEFDLLDNFDISNIEIDDVTIKSFTHVDYKLLIDAGKTWQKNDQIKIKIVYRGSPPEAKRPPWVGGFVWEKDENENDWVGLACQGEGGKIWFPCKDHPSDEPDSAAINITVPEDYFVAANGLLRKESYPKPGHKTYHWFTGYPINNYLINFGMGKFEKVEKKYLTESGKEMPVVFYVLPQMRFGADSLLDQAVDMLESYRKFFGEYPWTDEKLGLLNTSFLGMEHQTIIAYGNKYHNRTIGDLSFDQLLLHELGHEWWGNKVTAGDWGDFWIQEGICTYGEALYVLDKSGEEAYHEYMRRFQRRIWNRSPIASPKNTTSNDAYSGDIYTKGAAFMHTLRFVIGDSVFFPTLKQFATDSAYTFHNFVSTNDLLNLVNKNSGMALDSLFNLYLYTTDYPQIRIDSLSANSFNVSIPNINFNLPMEVSYNGITDTLQIGKQTIQITSDSRPVVDEKNWYLKEVAKTDE